MLTLTAIEFSPLSRGQGNLFRTGHNTGPDYSNDLKPILHAESEDFIHLWFHGDILNLLARFEQLLISVNASASAAAAHPLTSRRRLQAVLDRVVSMVV